MSPNSDSEPISNKLKKDIPATNDNEPDINNLIVPSKSKFAKR